MTMNSMLDKLMGTDREVSKMYLSETREYRFTIKENGIQTDGYFKWNEDETITSRDKRQRQFIENLLRSHEKAVRNGSPKTNSGGFDTELFNRGSRAYICLDTDGNLGIPVCVERIDYAVDTLPSFEGHFCDILSECSDPIERAYNLAVKARDGKDVNIEDIIDFLGEALAE